MGAGTRLCLWPEPVLSSRFLSHSELAPLRVPLVPMEHCTSRFFQECDADKDKQVSLKEWTSCFGIKTGENMCCTKVSPRLWFYPQEASPDPRCHFHCDACVCLRRGHGRQPVILSFLLFLVSWRQRREATLNSVNVERRFTSASVESFP